MRAHHCCEIGDPAPPVATRRARSIGGYIAPVFPAAILALMPKCPACVAAYIALATGVGISIGTATYLRIGLTAICVGSLAYLAARRIRRVFRFNSTTHVRTFPIGNINPISELRKDG